VPKTTAANDSQVKRVFTMLNEKIDIQLLAECPEHIPALATLLYEEISRDWVTDSSVARVEQKLHEHLQLDRMPLAYVALWNGNPIGVACLRPFDGIREELCPWLSSLAVHPSHRRQEVGKKLIAAVQQQAKQFGYTRLYLLAFDKTIPAWYAKLGWQGIGYDMLFDHTVTVMSLAL
jgi:N-acetylglutamate synthase-like GNAT family acetyltransferase